MKKHSKSKNPSSNISKPDIVSFMAKIQEQLLALERKMDSWMGQLAARSFPVEGRVQSVSSPFATSQQKKEAAPIQMPTQSHSSGRRERILHKAICADCKKDCEVPFKPTGERPVYCKPCFSKRKNKGPIHSSSQTVVQEKRQIKVTPNGAGKVTVSEVVAAPVRGTSSKRKSPKSVSKAKR